MLTEVQKDSIREIFDDAKFDDGTGSVHVDNIDHRTVVDLANLHVEYDVALNLKRSGTGITIQFSPAVQMAETEDREVNHGEQPVG